MSTSGNNKAIEDDADDSFNVIEDIVRVRAADSDDGKVIEEKAKDLQEDSRVVVGNIGAANKVAKQETKEGSQNRTAPTNDGGIRLGKAEMLPAKKDDVQIRAVTTKTTTTTTAVDNDGVDFIMDIVQSRATEAREDVIMAAYQEKSSNLEAKIVSEAGQLEEMPPETAPVRNEPAERVGLAGRQVVTRSSQPGAYSGTNGEGLSARDPLPFSLVGNHPPTGMESAAEDNNQLAEATPVEDDDPIVHQMEAQPFDTKAAERKNSNGDAQQRNKVLGLACYLLSVIVVVVVVVTSLNGGSNKQAIAITAPSAAPSSNAPSDSPSVAPTGALDLMIENLSNETLERLELVDSPQWKAMVWLQNHPRIRHMEEWRKTQLFALAAFFYSMDGDNWQKEISGSWLRYERHECYWFSGINGFIAQDGDYDTETGMDFQDLNLTTPCINNSTFQSLILFELDTVREGISIPPEIALLSSLNDLGLNRSNISASLSQFIPTTLYTLPNLTYVDLDRNNLRGNIPTKMGKMTGLERLAIERNVLTGPIPSEMGLMTSMRHLTMERNQLSSYIPTEMGLMTSIQKLNVRRNKLNGTIPVELVLMKDVEELYLDTNSLTGVIPSQLGSLTKLENLQLQRNNLMGSLPSQLGRLTSMTNLYLSKNMLVGSIPTEVGQLTQMGDLEMWNNALSGTIPSQLGQLTMMTWLALVVNELSGAVPSELGQATELTTLALRMNNLSGSLPSELGLLWQVEQVRLENNTLSGTVPSEMGLLAQDGSVFTMTLANNSIFGSIPESLCSLGLYKESWKAGLSFDCNDQLCGCCWCPCPGSNYTGECVTVPFVPSRDNEAWPGVYPTPTNRTNTVTINVYTDNYPEDLTIRWMKLEEDGEWKVEDIIHPRNASSLLSYSQEAKSASIYRLEMVDSFSDGTCCGFGFGWFSVTNATKLGGEQGGTVMWAAGGYELKGLLEVFFWVDEVGHAQLAEYIPGQGYALVQDDQTDDHMIMFPDLQ